MNDRFNDGTTDGISVEAEEGILDGLELSIDDELKEDLADSSTKFSDDGLLLRTLLGSDGRIDNRLVYGTLNGSVLENQDGIDDGIDNRLEPGVNDGFVDGKAIGFDDGNNVGL